VLPADFELLFPPRTGIEPNIDVWTSMRLNFDTAARNTGALRVIGRLKDGVSLAQAQTELDGFAATLREQFPPKKNVDLHFRAVNMHADLVSDVRPLVLALLGALTCLAGVVAFRQAKTTVNPMKPDTTSSLVVSGIYRYTRNPMYLGFLLLLAGLWAAYEWWRRRRLPPQRLFWAAGAVSGLAAIVALECGWVVTEVGRQPWVVYRLLRTAQAATTNGGVLTSLSLIIVVYAVLGAATIAILRLLSRRWRRGDLEEAAVPYGPNPAPQDLAAGEVGH